MAYYRKPYKKTEIVKNTSLPSITPNPFQSAFAEAVKEDFGNLQLMARAGTGKSTTILWSLQFIPQNLKTLFVAFNKDIATELNTRIPESFTNVTASTLHSLGFKAIMFNLGKTQMDKNKTRHLLNDVDALKVLGIDAELAEKFENRVCKAVSLCKNTLTSEIEDILPLCFEYDINVSEEDEEIFCKTVYYILQLSKKIVDIIDFDDMIWLPVVKKLNIMKYDIVYCDECQDLNNCQMELISMTLKANSRFFAVGDDRQAIYGFRGATSGAMKTLEARFNMKVLSLPITYRCPVKVVNLAKEIVQDYQAGPNNPEGDLQEDSFDNLPSAAEHGDFILSRSNAPLVKLAFRFFPLGKKAVVKGKDFGTNLINIVKAYKGDISEFTNWLDNYEKKEVERLLKRNPKANSDLIQDKIACLKVISEDATIIKEIILKIENLFQDEGNPSYHITLSTVHKAKGLEANKVFYLKDTFLKYTNEEEYNMLYVAITRAKKILVKVFGDGKDK